MTRAPRPRSTEERSPSAADLERMFDKLGQQIQGSEERTGDKLSRVEAKGDARQEINNKAQADTAAGMDALKEGQRAQAARLDEVVATNLRGYRTLEQAQVESRLAAEKQAERLEALEKRAAPEAADIAMHVGAAVVASNRTDNKRIAGIAVVGGAGALGAAFMGCANFVANHTAFVVRCLHAIGFGLGKIPEPPHE